MDIRVQLNDIRTAPRKSRLVVDLVRNKHLQEARNILHFTTNKTAASILKLLNSAAASAVNDMKLQEDNLFISKITVDEGPKLKRSHPMSRGRAYPIIKRTSRIALTLSEVKPTQRNEKPVKVVKAKPEITEAKVKKVTKTKK